MSLTWTAVKPSFYCLTSVATSFHFNQQTCMLFLHFSPPVKLLTWDSTHTWIQMSSLYTPRLGVCSEYTDTPTRLDGLHSRPQCCCAATRTVAYVLSDVQSGTCTATVSCWSASCLPASVRLIWNRPSFPIGLTLLVEQIFPCPDVYVSPFDTLIF